MARSYNSAEVSEKDNKGSKHANHFPEISTADVWDIAIQSYSSAVLSLYTQMNIF